jgi:hypothetical protein
MILDRLERNALLEAVKNAGANPRDLEPFIDDERVRFRDRSSGSYFEMHDTPAGRVVKLKVGDADEGTRPVGVIREVAEVLRIWIRMVEDFRTAPDLWAELGHDPIAELAEGQENRPFTPAEQAEIARVLEEIKRTARESWTLDFDQVHAVEAGVDFLITASLRLGRKDWLMVVYSVLGAKVLDVALQPDVAEKVASAIVSGLGALFGHPPGLLGQ